MVSLVTPTEVLYLLIQNPLDSVIWMGDFNYRIGLGAEKVKQLIKVGDLDTLYENDQVCSPSLLEYGLTAF
jgi:hypothetical protein